MVPLTGWQELPEERMLEEADAFLARMRRRRTVRDFSDRPVPREVIERCLLAAGTAPNGANRQPWHFVAVGSPDVKRRIREAAEEEEREFYSGRAPPEWLDALAHLGTDEHKPFLERAPWLVAIFGESYEVADDGRHLKNYYVTESVGIATGMLITALHHAGLASLTHTPSPMKFLNDVLGRPRQREAVPDPGGRVSGRGRHGSGHHQEAARGDRDVPGMTSTTEPMTSSQEQPVRAMERVLGRVRGARPGPTLLCIAGLHGNEPAGVLATRRVLEHLAPRAGRMVGDFVALAGNRRALTAKRRFLDRDLNRAWTDKRLARLRSEIARDALEAEDLEQVELLDAIEEVVSAARGPGVRARPAHHVRGRRSVHRLR